MGLRPRDREEIARREARERRRRMILNTVVALTLLLLTAIGIRYETRPGASREAMDLPRAEGPR